MNAKMTTPLTLEAITHVIQKEMRSLEERLEERIDDKLVRLENRIDTKLDKLRTDIDDNARTYRDETLTKMDGIVKELETERIERALKIKEDEEVKNKVNNHEKRITKLETN